MVKVYIWEMDHFSGRKLDDIKEFDTKREALLFVKDFNSENNKSIVPDWYMYASIEEY